ncbi:energy-coupling factor transporter transmembrane component T family protein [Alkalihalobacterium bogoriense]|uniref:energy-coupling factor transporter transmembrane component T family protein n=1 Tax=Alkalihalobacterium bogoriense TaxID=246272 RepID=UPI00047A3268|nr:energy-coupling factor transporter transmembrane component T [Alkalihalobacterium bogoriense]
MFSHVIIGQYVDGHSYLHRLDPRSKLLAILFFIIIIFLANNWTTYVLISAVAIGLVLLSRVSLRFIYRGLKPVFFLLVFTLVVHIIINKEGALVYEWGPFAVYEGGITNGVFICIRLLVIFLLTSLLTLTTPPLDLTDGLESLLRPFKRVGVPAHELALMMSISLRFIPTLLQETEKIMKAQMARGVDFKSGPITDRVKAIFPLLIPLFIHSFKRAEDLATAMESRGYRGGEGRTKIRVLQWTRKDSLVFIVISLIAIGLLLFRS